MPPHIAPGAPGVPAPGGESLAGTVPAAGVAAASDAAGARGALLDAGGATFGAEELAGAVASGG